MLKADCAREVLVSNGTFAFAGVEFAGNRENNRVAWPLLHFFLSVSLCVVIFLTTA